MRVGAVIKQHMVSLVENVARRAARTTVVKYFLEGVKDKEEHG